jgi:hypothetical protein
MVRGADHVRRAADSQPDEHLTCFVLGEIQLLNGERLPELLENGGADLYMAPFNGGLER